MKRTVHYLSLILLLTVTGCNSVKDVTLAPGNRTDFVAGQIYEISKPVFLYKFDRKDVEETSRLARLGFAGTPEDLPTFLSRAPQNPQVNGLLMPGTQIVVTKFIEAHHPEAGTFFEVYAVITSGEHKGKTVEVELLKKSGSPWDKTLIDPDYLAPVK